MKTKTIRNFELALIVILERESFKRITVDQICRKASLHRSTFYHYFRDKFDLLEQTLKHWFFSLVANAKNENELITTMVNSIARHQEFYNHLNVDHDYSLDTEILKISSKVLLDLRKSGPSDGLLVQVLRASSQPQLITYAISGSLMGTLHWWQEENFTASPTEIVRILNQMLVSFTKNK